MERKKEAVQEVFQFFCDNFDLVIFGYKLFQVYKNVY